MKKLLGSLLILLAANGYGSETPKPKDEEEKKQKTQTQLEHDEKNKERESKKKIDQLYAISTLKKANFFKGSPAASYRSFY